MVACDLLPVNRILTECKNRLPFQYRRAPWRHPELCHGWKVLGSEEAVDCYLAAYGEAHYQKIIKACQFIPFGKISDHFRFLIGVAAKA